MTDPLFRQADDPAFAAHYGDLLRAALKERRVSADDATIDSLIGGDVVAWQSLKISGRMLQQVLAIRIEIHARNLLTRQLVQALDPSLVVFPRMKRGSHGAQSHH
jgi:hypothetical protein